MSNTPSLDQLCNLLNDLEVVLGELQKAVSALKRDIQIRSLDSPSKLTH